MDERIGYANLIIDYASLACFWSRLTDEQKVLIHHEQFDYLPDDAIVSSNSVLIVWSKLTDAQKKLIHCGFFHGSAKKGRVSKIQKEILLEIQNKHEIITNQDLINKIGKIRKKKKGPSGGTSPGPKAKSQITKLAEKIGHTRCWYTDEDCHITTSRMAWAATREHIIPQAYGWNGENRNTVIAADFINNLLGCAPVHVKMHVKNELNKISCHPSLDGEQKRKIYRQIVKNILDQYRVCGSLPWDNPSRINSSKSTYMNTKSSIIEMAYWRHMIIQKNYVDNIRKNSNNIRGYLEEKCNGMETGFKQAHGFG